MNLSFNYYHELNDLEFYLCNPDGRELYDIVAYNRVVTLRFNDISQLEFDAPAKITKNNGTTVDADYYDFLETKRIISVPNLGFFKISKIEEHDDGINKYKSIEAESLQVVFKDKGFVSEERVYCFYNPNDPYDATYDSFDDGALPSVVGQLSKQLGIAISLQATPVEYENPFDTWTLVYINQSLIYTGTGSVCRTFKENTTYGYDFMINDVENAFNVVVLFDFRTRAIYVKTIDEITERANLCLSFENFMKNIDVQENASDIVTVLTCTGNNLDITAVNPTGTNYIVDFSYYMDEVNHKWMSQALINKLKDWQDDVDASRTTYSNLVQQLRSQYASKTSVDTKLQEASIRVQDLDTAASQFADYQTSGDTSSVGSLLGVVMAEKVPVSENSLSPNSSYYSSAFIGTSTITAYQNVPSYSNGVWTFSGTPTTDTADNLCAAIAGGSTPYLYFADGDNISYCKLTAKAALQPDQTTVYSCSGFDRYIAMNGVHSYGSVSGRASSNITITSINASTFETAARTNGTAADKLKNKYQFIYTVDPSSIGSTPVYTWQYNGSNVTLSNWGISISYTTLSNWNFIIAKMTPDVVYWKQLQEEYAETLRASSAYYQGLIDTTTASLNAISSSLNILNYFASTPTLLKELGHYWIEGSYENENISVLETTTEAEEIDLANELVRAGEIELAKVSQPRFSFSADANNLLACYEFRDQSKELELGKVITIEKEEGVWYYPAILEMEFNLDDLDEFSMTFANATRLDDWGYTFADMITNSSQTSHNVNANWQNLMDYSKNKRQINSLIRNPLNAALMAAEKDTTNQEFSVSDSGILGRKTNSGGGFDGEQVRLINNLLIFTDDNWKTAKTALGKISYEDEYGQTQTSYGLIAETIVGEFILGESLKIVNHDNTFTIDDEGMNFNNNFIVDAQGNVQLNGSITWGTGSSPTQVLYARNSITKPSNNTPWSSYPSSSTSGWHRTYNSTYDFFMSCTYDGGTTWTTAIRFAGQNGEAGDSLGSVYLYHRATSNTAPTYVDTYSTNISSYGWTAAPQGTTSTYLYEYVLPYSESTDGSTGVTTYTRTGTPAVWAKFGKNGSDATVNSTNVFNALTNDATIFGAFSDVGGALYINASYINTGILSVGNAKGTIFYANWSTKTVYLGETDVQALVPASGGRWTVGLLPGTDLNGMYNIATIGSQPYIYGLQASNSNDNGIFFVKQGNTMAGTTATFYVLPDGYMYCAYGQIGNWQITQDGKLLFTVDSSSAIDTLGAVEIRDTQHYTVMASDRFATGTYTTVSGGALIKTAKYALDQTYGLTAGGSSYAQIAFTNPLVTTNSGKDITLKAAGGDNCIILKGRPVLIPASSYISGGYGNSGDMGNIVNPQEGQLFFAI